MTANAPISRRTASSALVALGALTALRAAGAATSGQSTAATPPALPPLMSFDEAVGGNVQAVFSTAPLPDAGTVNVVIDPLVDGVTGYQSDTTRSIQDRILAIVKRDFPRYSVQRITPDSLRQQPRVLIGTFTPVNAQNRFEGEREAFRFCLVMGDLKTGRVVAKAVRRARIGGFDAKPTAAFADSPVWTADPSVQAYVASCQETHVGDPIKAEYLDGLLTAALLSEAADAYDEGRYAEALQLYLTAKDTPAGDQLRVYNGIYLCQRRLGAADATTAAFRDLVEFGLRRKRLALKFLFRPGSVRFVADTNLSADYDMWLRQIAAQAGAARVCLRITGHTSPTGLALLNDRLSLLRAEYIRTQLGGDEPSLKDRTQAVGVGSRENLIGTGRDDATDALDRRVEIAPIEHCGQTT